MTNAGADLDGLFDALSHQRRRFALYYLREHDPAALDSLARHVAAWERRKTADAVSAEECEPVLTDLYHNHLPKLADVSILEYDRRTGAIRFRDPPRLLDGVLELACEQEHPTKAG